MFCFALAPTHYLLVCMFKMYLIQRIGHRNFLGLIPVLVKGHILQNWIQLPQIDPILEKKLPSIRGIFSSRNGMLKIIYCIIFSSSNKYLLSLKFYQHKIKFTLKNPISIFHYPAAINHISGKYLHLLFFQYSISIHLQTCILTLMVFSLIEQVTMDLLNQVSLEKYPCRQRNTFVSGCSSLRAGMHNFSWRKTCKSLL